MWFYKFCKVFTMAFYNLFYPHKVIGKENLPKDKNYIFICNHYGKIDIIVVSELFKRRPYFLAKKEMMKGKLMSKIMRAYGLIPVDRGRADIAALKECFAGLKKGENLIIFPEGTRNKHSEELLKLNGGASMIAFKSGVQIVPAVMYKHFKMFKKNYLYIGKPFDYSDYKGQKLTSELSEKLVEIMRLKMEECRKDVKEIVEGKN